MWAGGRKDGSGRIKAGDGKHDGRKARVDRAGWQGVVVRALEHRSADYGAGQSGHRPAHLRGPFREAMRKIRGRGTLSTRELRASPIKWLGERHLVVGDANLIPERTGGPDALDVAQSLTRRTFSADYALHSERALVDFGFTGRDWMITGVRPLPTGASGTAKVRFAPS